MVDHALSRYDGSLQGGDLLLHHHVQTSVTVDMDVEMKVLEGIPAETKDIVPQGEPDAKTAVIVSHGIGAGLVVEDGDSGNGLSRKDVADSAVDIGVVSPGILRLAYLVYLVGKGDHLVCRVDEPEEFVVHSLVLPVGEESRRQRGVYGLVTYLEIAGGGVRKRDGRDVDRRDAEFRPCLRHGGAQCHGLLGGEGGSARIPSCGRIEEETTCLPLADRCDAAVLFDIIALGGIKTVYGIPCGHAGPGIIARDLLVHHPVQGERAFVRHFVEAYGHIVAFFAEIDETRFAHREEVYVVAVNLDRRTAGGRDGDQLLAECVDIEGDVVVPPAVVHHSSHLEIGGIPIIGAVIRHVVPQCLTGPEQQGIVGSRLLEGLGLGIFLSCRRDKGQR